MKFPIPYSGVVILYFLSNSVRTEIVLLKSPEVISKIC